MNEYPDTPLTMVEPREVDIPVTPLLNLGEGGPTDSGGDQNSGANAPVILLPSPGESGSVNNGNRPGFPSIFRPIFLGNSGSVTMVPGVTFPCYSCTTASFGGVRILNASTGYQPFHVYLGNWIVASGLGNGNITGHVQSASGIRTVTMSGVNSYVYIRGTVQVHASASMTIAIINTASGLDTMKASDTSCNAPSGTSCLRTYNLSLNLGSLNVSIGSQSSPYTVFSNIRCEGVTPCTNFYPGWYQLYVSRTGSYPNILVTTTSTNMSANTSYTLYIFDAPNVMDGLKTLVVSN